MSVVWFENPNGGTISVDTPKDFLEGLQKWNLVDGQTEAIKSLAEIPFDTLEGSIEKARTIEEYRAFLAKGWKPLLPSDVDYRMQILKNHI